MINVQNRINEIMNRIAGVNQRFNKLDNNPSGFKETLAEVQERVFNEKSLNSMEKFNAIIEEKAQKYYLPVKLVKSVIKQESNFNPKAVSVKGAKGLMQLMPQTADLLGVKNIFDPEENIEAGVKYLRMMWNRFNGDIEKVLAAYNAGPEIVEQKNGVPDYSETKQYIKNIIKNWESL